MSLGKYVPSVDGVIKWIVIAIVAGFALRTIKPMLPGQVAGVMPNL